MPWRPLHRPGGKQYHHVPSEQGGTPDQNQGSNPQPDQTPKRRVPRGERNTRVRGSGRRKKGENN